MQVVIDFLAGLYPWTKALHIMAVIAWMAGLLYLPRLFVYHCDTTGGAADSERFKVMERRLLRAIMNPAMIAAYLFGTALLLTPGVVDWHAGWIYVKLAAIAVLTGMHHVYAIWYQHFAADGPRRSPKVYRIANEVPALMMIIIVIMVVVRPF
jgi:protoporphyrinogen IX oxidase